MTKTPAVLGGAPRFSYRLNIVRPTFPPLDSFSAEFDSALRSGQVTNDCQYVRQFEQAMESMIGAPALAFNNGQSALMAMLKASGVAGGSVICPSFTFSATPHAIHWAGARPHFVDIDDTLCVDPDAVESAIDDSTRAILGVDPYGICCDYDRLSTNGRPIGQSADAQAFSFHATKAFSTMEGGAVTSTDMTLMASVRAIRNFGQVRAADCDIPGINGKMTEVCALIGLAQLPALPAIGANRRKAVAKMAEGLSHVPGLGLPRIPSNQDPIWLYFPFVVDPGLYGLTRDQLALALEKENVMVRRYFDMPCHKMACYPESVKMVLPRTEYVTSNIISLPVYNDMSDDEAEGITQCIRSIHEHARAVASALK